MKIHLVDGTYELFRAFYSSPASEAPGGGEVGALRGLMRSLLALLGEEDVTHVAIAFDHVIESFRNELYAGYKTGEGVDPLLLAQFEPAELAARVLGIVTWPMVEFEADDALATAAARFVDAPGVDQIVLCSPDKDLAQCVQDARVVCLDRMRRKLLDQDGVVEKFGVPPQSIPDWLALVGDSADGFPGIPRWGAKSASAVLAEYGTLERIPDDPRIWRVKVRGADTLAMNLRTMRDQARLFRRLATLRTDAPLTETLEDLRWRGPDEQALRAYCDVIGDEQVPARARRLTETKLHKGD
jgi:5'-3' exonuclease